MYEKAQDRMNYVRNYGDSEFFITFTCNSKWKKLKISHFPARSKSLFLMYSVQCLPHVSITTLWLENIISPNI